MRKLFLVRHGETPESRDDIIQGRANTRLTNKGKAEALAAANYLAEFCTVRAIVSSDLVRATETAAIIAARVRFIDTIDQVPELQELSCGVLEGRPFAELEEMRRQSPLGADFVVPPGGESFDQMRIRVLNWWLGFQKTALDGTIIITHRGPILAILETMHMPITEVTKLAALSNCSVATLNESSHQNFMLESVWQVNTQRSNVR